MVLSEGLTSHCSFQSRAFYRPVVPYLGIIILYNNNLQLAAKNNGLILLTRQILQDDCLKLFSK